LGKHEFFDDFFKNPALKTTSVLAGVNAIIDVDGETKVSFVASAGTAAGAQGFYLSVGFALQINSQIC
jgi:hypothetical protein